MQRWEIEAVVIHGADHEEIEQVNQEWLAKGWEPFAVIGDVPVATVWLRRMVPYET